MPTPTVSGRNRVPTIHPTRVAIVDLMRDGEPRSPADLSRVLELSLGATAYHVRKLAADGTIKLVREGRVRGAVEHFYKLDGRRARTQPENLPRVALEAADLLDEITPRLPADARDLAKRLRRAAASAH